MTPELRYTTDDGAIFRIQRPAGYLVDQEVSWSTLRAAADQSDPELRAFYRDALARAEAMEAARRERIAKAPPVRVVYGLDSDTRVWFRAEVQDAYGYPCRSPLRDCGGTVATLALARSEAEAMAQALGVPAEEVAEI